MDDSIIQAVITMLSGVVGYGAVRSELVIIRKLLQAHSSKLEQHEDKHDVVEGRLTRLESKQKSA